MEFPSCPGKGSRRNALGPGCFVLVWNYQVRPKEIPRPKQKVVATK